MTKSSLLISNYRYQNVLHHRFWLNFYAMSAFLLHFLTTTRKGILLTVKDGRITGYIKIDFDFEIDFEQCVRYIKSLLTHNHRSIDNYIYSELYHLTSSYFTILTISVKNNNFHSKLNLPYY